MRSPLLLSAILCVVFASQLRAADTYIAGRKTNKTFKGFAQPFLDNYCLDCHDDAMPASKKGGLSLESLGPVNEANAGLWKSIWAQVTIKQMPPKKKDQPEVAERLLFSDWVVEELARALRDKGGFHAHLDPKKANYLDHDLLFGALPSNIKLVPTSTPARIWRLTPEEHITRLNDLVNKEPAVDPKRPGLRAHGDVVPIDPEGARRIYFALDRLNGRGGPSFRKGLKAISPVLAPARSHGLDNYPILSTVNSSESLQILDQAKDIIRFMAYGPASFVPDPKKQITDVRQKILPATSDPANVYYTTKVMRPLTPVYELMKSKGASDKQMRAAVDFLFEALTFRPPTRQESDQHLEIVREAVAELGLDKGATIGLAAVFLNRDALFRPELVAYGKPDAHGRVMLQDWELGLAVNHALGYIKPDPALKSAIVSGRMRTRADVKREVERILNDQSIRKPRILQFFRDYFDYDLAGQINKDAQLLVRTRVVKKVNPHYGIMNSSTVSTDRFVQLILEEDKDVFKQLLTTDKVVLDKVGNGSRDRGYSAYLFHSAEDLLNKNKKNKKNKKDKKNKKNRGKNGKKANTSPIKSKKVIHASVQRTSDRLSMSSERWLTTLPKDQRRGILTHPMWLISHSDAMDNHAIHRGIWVRTRLLGGAIPDVPVSVDAMLPDEPQSTLRHRMRVTRERYCWSCHGKIDPLGLPFEMYNHVGVYRTTEQGKPVDATGEITDSGDPKLDGKVKNAIEMIDKLAASERVEQVFVRHAFRFWIGRNETLNDRPVLRAAHKAYRDSGGSMKALITSLLTSDAFLYRRGNR